MPYKGDHAVVFPMDESANVLLVFGDNMRGKTSFLNALRWCFYGEAVGRNLAPINSFDIVNTDAAAEGDWRVSVMVKFEHDGNEFELRRTMEPKRMVHQPASSKDLIDQVMLRKNGAVVRTDEIVHEINQVIPKDIARFFLFDGELLQEYEMLLNETSEQGKRIKDEIEKILGVPAFLKAKEHLDHLLREARKKQTQESKRIDSVRKISEQVSRLESEWESLNADLESLKVKQEDMKADKADLDQSIEESQSILVAKDQLDQCKVDLKRLESEQDEKLKRKHILLKVAWKDMVFPLIDVELNYLNKEELKLEKSREQQIKISAQVANLRSILEHSICPTCTQELAPDKRAEIDIQLSKLETDLATYTTDLDVLRNIRDRIRLLSTINKTPASDGIPDLESELRRINLEITKIDNRIAELEAQLRSHDTAEIAKKRIKRDQFIAEMARNSDRIRDVESDMDKNDRQRAALAHSIDSNADARSQRSSKLAQAYEGLKSVFTDSVTSLRESLKSRVEELATEAFSALTTEPTYVGLRINENYGLIIIDRENREVAQRSAGAEQIVALSLIDGLNRTARKSGPIVMDTPLGRLDLKHRDKVLKYLPQMAEQVILLVHEGEIRKEEVVTALEGRIGGVYNIERISSSESSISKE